jgi:sulfate/thiosulfate transport system permease protein
LSTEALAHPAGPPARSSELSARLGRWGLRGIAVAYLLAMIAVPVAAIVVKGFGRGMEALQGALSSPGAVAAIKLTLITSVGAAIINAILGTLLAYVLVRYRFPGRTLLSGIVDLPFAIPTLVTGVMLVALYGPSSPLGGWLESHGMQIAYAPPGIMLALMFVTLPFVVRTVQPVLEELDVAEEEAARVLGAGSWTTFRKVVLPALRGAIAAGTLLSFARATGEFGSVVLISGNLIGKTVTAPFLIFQLTSQFKPEEAAAVSAVLFGVAFVLVLITYRVLRRGPEAL